ncbi:hypothetical protein PS6_003046 [Mucor atramentarius]
MRSILYGLLAFSGISSIVAQSVYYSVTTTTAEDYKVTSLPGIDISTLNFTQYAGHIEISSETNANLFFWMIENEMKPDNEKLVTADCDQQANERSILIYYLAEWWAWLFKVD